MAVFTCGLTLSVWAGVGADDKEASSSPATTGGYLKASFDQLATFKIAPPAFDPNAKPGSAVPSLGAQIPEAIRALDGKKAVVTGFMLPIKMEGGLVTEFLLMRSQMMCCYGAIPLVNEWILVHMPKGVNQPMGVPVSCGGLLHAKNVTKTVSLPLSTNSTATKYCRPKDEDHLRFQSQHYDGGRTGY